MARAQSTNKMDQAIRARVTKVRPPRYSLSNPHKLNNDQHLSTYLNKYWWQPGSGPSGLPQTPEAQQARIDKLFAAMTDFSDVFDSDNAFTEGRVIDNDDIEFTCLRIANAIDKLHQHGLAIPYVADPTMKEISTKRQKKWRIEQDERDLTPKQREDAIADHLKHYKKACLDAIDHDKDLVILFVAAPITAGKKRDATARSNSNRKQRANTTALVADKAKIDMTDKLMEVSDPVDVQATQANCTNGQQITSVAGNVSSPSSVYSGAGMFTPTQTTVTANQPIAAGFGANGDNNLSAVAVGDDNAAAPTSSFDMGIDWSKLEEFPEHNYDWILEPQHLLIGDTMDWAGLNSNGVTN
jgi:hypothetical protein